MPLFLGHHQTRHHPAIRCPVVAVVEHRDGPAPAQPVEEVEQRARPLRELETQHHLIVDPLGMPANHVADVQFGQFVVGQVQHRKTLPGETGDQRAAWVVLRVSLHADEDMGFTVGVVAVVEFSDLALADGFAERLETARLLGNGHGNDRLAAFAQFGTLGHVAQAVKVDVGAGVDGHQRLAGHAALLDVLLDACNTQRTRRLGDRAGVVVDVLDRRADFVGADGDHFIDVMTAHFKGVITDLRHRHAIGKQPDLAQHHALARRHRRLQAVGVVGLDADDLDLRPQVFHVRCNPCNQAAATDRHKDRVQLPRLLTEDFHRHSALPGNGVGVVIRMDVDEALLLDQFQRIGQRFREGIAVQHHRGTAGTHPFDLDFRGGARHDDGGQNAQLFRRQRQALGVIARRGRDHAACGLFCGQLGELVVRAANLEGEHRLQIFALEQHLIAQPLGQLTSAVQRGFDRYVVDARGEDFLDVLFKHRGRHH
ncbi:Uncharacterized protein AC502_5511 [Pseudomonas syringae pv. maculicola]|nr:Uncharacterized protein AC502_5511 [Pseudomonas syringae pv. maculicola]